MSRDIPEVGGDRSNEGDLNQRNDSRNQRRRGVVVRAGTDAGAVRRTCVRFVGVARHIRVNDLAGAYYWIEPCRPHGTSETRANPYNSSQHTAGPRRHHEEIVKRASALVSGPRRSSGLPDERRRRLGRSPNAKDSSSEAEANLLDQSEGRRRSTARGRGAAEPIRGSADGESNGRTRPAEGSGFPPTRKAR